MAQGNRIAERITGSQRFTLNSHIHPNAKAEYDQGRADASLTLNSVTLVLKPSTSQQADLDRLLAEQQDPASKNYHAWLTPEAYADRFGATQGDIDKIVEWLQGQGLTVTNVARGRNAVAVCGTAPLIESAFGTQIHLYKVDGETHYANSTEPSLPAALRGVVQAIHGLHDFRLKAKARKLTSLGVAADGVSPAYTSSTTGNHYLAPDDLATIFDIQALYSAGINGSGQKIAIVGQSTIVTSHLTTFRSYFSLSTASLTTTLVPNTQNPGYSESDAEESDLDLQWASAVARDAKLIFVYSYDVTDAVQYAIDQNLAPVVSMSYGSCEASWTRADALTLQSWAQQANAQGITWVAASGDSGAADCYQTASGPFGGASSNFGLATDMPASIPEVTGVGGTRLNEGSGSYWNSSNSSTKASARSYIPETAWNDSVADGAPSASGGGASTLFSKPSWQTGTGVPSDGARDVPDVALPASADHDGYMVYTNSSGQAGWYVFGGTSVGAPSFSGMLALLNQYLIGNGYQSSSGLGNVNGSLYRLATSTPNAFHDITSGDNIVSQTSTCIGRRCTPGGTTSVGYSTTTGYDRVTGLGSVDAYNLVTAWHLGSLLTKSTPTLTLAASPAKIATAGSTTLTATVTSTNNTTPTGTVSFSVGSTTLGTATLSGAGSSATASLTISGATTGLGLDANTVTAAYGGDDSNDAATATTALTVVSASSVAPSIGGATNAASYQQSYAPGMILSIFGTDLALSTKSISSLPLATVADNVSVTINGVAAPLYYISPTQLNVQIPYETPTSGTVALVVSDNGQTASSTLQMSAAAPGIFTDSSGAVVPTGTAKAGDTITLFVTGAGAVSPTVTTGSVPDTGTTPVPKLTTLVTAAGVQASTTYIGTPSWSVGVLQINFTIPATATPGTQSVVVKVGSVTSAAATLTVTQ